VSNIYLALSPGGSRRARTAHPPSNASDDDAPSVLLGPLLEWPDLLGLVLARLDPTDCALLGQVGKQWLAAVVSRGLPRAGKGSAVRLELRRFVASAKMLAWAKANGCPWHRTCNSIARGGHLAVLQWAREHDCPWSGQECETAAVSGHLEVLQWARGSTARGMSLRVHMQLWAGIWRCCSGRGSTTARGMIWHVHTPLRMGIWRCCSGRGSAAARGGSMIVNALPRATQRLWHGCRSSHSRTSASLTCQRDTRHKHTCQA